MRRPLLALVILTASAVTPVAFATPASAHCAPEGDYTRYTFTNVAAYSKLSNLRSDYLRGPGTISYTVTKTAEVNATMTATVSAEAGVIFAKASTSLGVSVGKSWSRSQQWSYTKPVPAGKTARLVMRHSTRLFTVNKYTWSNARCGYVKQWDSRVNAPLLSNSANVWGLQYR